MCQLCTGRQADYTPDPWTERRKAEVIADLARASGQPVHRFRWVLTALTAATSTSSINTLRNTP